MKLGDEQFAKARASGRRRAGWRWSASASSPASPTCSRGTPPTTCSPRSTSSAPATAPTSGTVDAATSFAPSFSIWTTIEECLNPPVIWEKDRGWFTTRAVQRAGGLRLPRGHRPGRVRQRGARGGAADAALGRRRRATFKYGLGDEFIDVLKTLHKLGLDRTEKVRVERRRGRRRATSWQRCCPTRRAWASG